MNQKNRTLTKEKRILIIDPVDTDRKIMAHFLRSHGYQVETGKGLADAIEKISENSFICITIDVDLPEMKGYKAIPMIKSIDPQIKIIMTTKKKHKEARSQSQGTGYFLLFHKIF